MCITSGRLYTILEHCLTCMRWHLSNRLVVFDTQISLACIYNRMKMVMLWLRFPLRTLRALEQCGTTTSKANVCCILSVYWTYSLHIIVCSVSHKNQFLKILLLLDSARNLQLGKRWWKRLLGVGILDLQAYFLWVRQRTESYVDRLAIC